MVAIGLDAGPHRREFVALSRDDYDDVNGVLLVGEGPLRRAIRLGTAARQALDDAAVRRGSDHLLATRTGYPLTDRTIHEQLLTIGGLAGLGPWVTARHTRQTFIATVSSRYALPIAMRLNGHGSERHRAASQHEALSAQLQPGWVSVLDSLLLTAARLTAA